MTTYMWSYDSYWAPPSFDQHMCTWCAHLLASSTLMDHKTSILKTTHVHASYQVTLVCIMLCQSIRMCLWRVDFMVSSSNFRYLLEPRDVAVISIDDGQWSYNWYPRIVISQQPWLSVMVRFLTVENLFLTMTNCHGQKWLGYCYCPYDK